MLLFQKYFRDQVKPIADILGWNDVGDHLTKLFFYLLKINICLIFVCVKICWKVLKALQLCVCVFLDYSVPLY